MDGTGTRQLLSEPWRVELNSTDSSTLQFRRADRASWWQRRILVSLTRLQLWSHEAANAPEEEQSGGFFARGRDYESVGDAHKYTQNERRQIESHQSIEYLPPNNAPYREYIARAAGSTQRARWLMMGLVGAAVGFVGYMLKSIIAALLSWRYSMIFQDW